MATKQLLDNYESEIIRRKQFPTAEAKTLPTVQSDKLVDNAFNGVNKSNERNDKAEKVTTDEKANEQVPLSTTNKPVNAEQPAPRITDDAETRKRKASSLADFDRPPLDLSERKKPRVVCEEKNVDLETCTFAAVQVVTGQHQHQPRQVMSPLSCDEDDYSADTYHHTNSGRAPKAPVVRHHPPYSDWGDKPVPDLPSKKRGCRKPNFPLVLYQILQNAEKEGYSTVCRWETHGRAFIIYQREAFEREVMPRCFRKKNKYESFRRQLNLYGFLRINDWYHNDHGAYYHERFLRGRPDLCHHINRMKVRGTGARCMLSHESEPNFDLYPSMPPLPPQDEKSASPPLALLKDRSETCHFASEKSYSAQQMQVYRVSLEHVQRGQWEEEDMFEPLGIYEDANFHNDAEDIKILEKVFQVADLFS